MKTPAARHKVAEMLCRGLPKSKARVAVNMSKTTFDRHFAALCEAAKLPRDGSIWRLNRDSIMRNLERYEDFKREEAERYATFRRSLEITDHYTGKSRVDEFLPKKPKKEKPDVDDLLT